MGSKLSDNSISFFSLKRYSLFNLFWSGSSFGSQNHAEHSFPRSGLLGLCFISAFLEIDTDTCSDMHESMFAFMCIHRCVTGSHTHFCSTIWHECMCTRSLYSFGFLCTQKHLRYRVSIHAASPKARVVHQGFHHLRHLHIIWPVIAVNIGDIINTNTHSNISVCNNVFNLISHRRSTCHFNQLASAICQNVNKTVQKAWAMIG